MKIHKVIFIIALLGLFLLINLNTIFAADQTITCNPSGSCVGMVSPFFSETNIKPTDKYSRTVEIRNNYTEDRDFALEIKSITFIDSMPSLAEKLNIIITSEDGLTTLYGPKTIIDWKDDGYITLTTIPANGSKILKFAIDFTNVDNSYQAKTLKFDLNMGFESLPVSPSPTVTSVPAPTSTPGAPSNSGSSDTNSSNSNSSSNNSSSDLGGVTFSNSVGQVLGADTYNVYATSPTPIATIASETVQVGDVAGAKTCKVSWWWILVCIIHIIFAYILNKVCKKQIGRICDINQILLAILVGFIYFVFFCNHWLVILAIFVGLSALFRKTTIPR